MTDTPDPYTAAVRRARPVLEELCVRLGIEELTIDTMATASRHVIGSERTALCIQAIRDHRLSRRYWQLGSWVAIVGAFTDPHPATPDTRMYQVTRPLPHDWWTNPLVDFDGDPMAATADDVLAGACDDPRYRMGGPWHTVLDALAARVADDAIAVAWHDDVDLNWPGDHRVEPVHADGTPLTVGEIVTVHYDTGGVIDGVVVEVDECAALLRISDDSSYTHTFPSHLDWCVHMTWRQERIYLPGEVPGTDSDPYAPAVSPTETARHFLATAAEHDPTAARLLERLDSGRLTLGDLSEATATYNSLHHPRPGVALSVERGLWGLMDGYPDEVATAERHLRGDYAQ